MINDVWHGNKYIQLCILVFPKSNCQELGIIGKKVVKSSARCIADISNCSQVV